MALFALWVLLATTDASALTKICDGPSACCPPVLADALASSVAVKLGVVLVGLYNVNEKSGTWDADFYLNESWTPTAGFTPATEIVNEISHQSEQFDDTELRDGRCFRSRRVHSTVHSNYDLRTFPFDHQQLTLEFSDAEFAQDFAHYTPQPVRRHITFHLTRFFLPLFVIVAVAFTVFWIDPDDLNSKSAIGVTCLLAAIAFQFAEAGTLPEIAYLTLADRSMPFATPASPSH